VKQSEYLRELKLNLESKIPPEELKDILSDYEGFFVTGREEGRRDDDISEELGSPALLARNLLEEYAGKQSGKACGAGKVLAYKPAVPGRRMAAWLLDAVIATLPVMLISLLVLKSIFLPYYMVLFYPSPAAATLLYLGVSSYGDLTLTSETNAEYTYVTRVDKNGEHMQTYTSVNADGGLIRKWRAGLGVLALVFYLLYPLICTLLLKGQTIGKKIMGIRVRRTDCTPAGRESIFSRELLGKLLLNSIPFVPLISLLTILLTKEHKALHDMVADTIVTAS
jgi:uncharacterized membrane protein